MFTRIAAGVFASACLVLAPAYAEDINYALHNETSYVVTEFYTSPANDNEWGGDLLGNGVLGAGESASVTIADGSDQCVYDFRFVFEDGDVVEDFGVDICELAEYTLTE
ncbi:hypothetical protein L2D01_00575 [Hyphomonadaceae bacterium ML37]|nr:hypothetical protein L2D01_00575 [Hyphomonadaceae bacterium ML37]